MSDQGGDDSRSIRDAYQAYGVDEFYRRFGAGYRNPHEADVDEVIRRLITVNAVSLSSALDLACGSGEATRTLRSLGVSTIDGIDPYTAEAYREATGLIAHRYSFEDIAAGALDDGPLAGRRYSLTVCSFAMHLVDVSRLPLLLWQIAEICQTLLIVTPHKRPDIRPEWGWSLADELVAHRVRGRLYRRIGQAAESPSRGPLTFRESLEPSGRS